MNETKLTAAVVGLTVMLATHVPVGAAEITVISSNALKTTLEQLAPASRRRRSTSSPSPGALPFR
jgi:hypothetical protein